MRHFDKEFEGKNIQDITTWQIEKYKAKRKEKLKPASVNRELALLKHIFSKALEWKKMKESPVKDVKRLKGETRRVRDLMPRRSRSFFQTVTDFSGAFLNPLSPWPCIPERGREN